MKAVAIVMALAYAVHAQQLRFDIASIRQLDSPPANTRYSTSGPRLTIAGYSIPLLLMEAYDLKNYQITASPPNSLVDGSYFWDITATAPGMGSPTHGEIRRMLQALLIDRFKLQTHRETREMPVYALVIDKNGLLLKPGSGGQPCAVHVGPLHPQDRNHQMQYVNCTLDPLVNTFQEDRPVVDKTGLTGRYDITLVATPEWRMRDSTQPGDISLRDAIRKLGLRLEARKEPIEMLVVDDVEKPDAN